MRGRVPGVTGIKVTLYFANITGNTIAFKLIVAVQQKKLPIRRPKKTIAVVTLKYASNRAY